MYMRDSEYLGCYRAAEPINKPTEFLNGRSKLFPSIPQPIHFNLTACKVMIYTRVGHYIQPHFKLAFSGGREDWRGKVILFSMFNVML